MAKLQWSKSKAKVAADARLPFAPGDRVRLSPAGVKAFRRQWDFDVTVIACHPSPTTRGHEVTVRGALNHDSVWASHWLEAMPK